MLKLKLRKLFCLPTIKDLGWGTSGLPIRKYKPDDHTWKDYELLMKKDYPIRWFICEEIPKFYNNLIGYRIKHLQHYYWENIRDRYFIVDCRIATKNTVKHDYDFCYYVESHRLLVSSFAVLLDKINRSPECLNTTYYLSSVIQSDRMIDDLKLKLKKLKKNSKNYKKNYKLIEDMIKSEEYNSHWDRERLEQMRELNRLVQWWNIDRKNKHLELNRMTSENYESIKNVKTGFLEREGALIEEDSEEGKKLMDIYRENNKIHDRMEEELKLEDENNLISLIKNIKVLD